MFSMQQKESGSTAALEAGQRGTEDANRVKVNNRPRSIRPRASACAIFRPKPSRRPPMQSGAQAQVNRCNGREGDIRRTVTAANLAGRSWSGQTLASVGSSAKRTGSTAPRARHGEISATDQRKPAKTGYASDARTLNAALATRRRLSEPRDLTPLTPPPQCHSFISRSRPERQAFRGCKLAIRRSRPGCRQSSGQRTECVCMTNPGQHRQSSLDAQGPCLHGPAGEFKSSSAPRGWPSLALCICGVRESLPVTVKFLLKGARCPPTRSSQGSKEDESSLDARTRIGSRAGG